jgi:hypothetical protein
MKSLAMSIPGVRTATGPGCLPWRWYHSSHSSHCHELQAIHNHNIINFWCNNTCYCLFVDNMWERCKHLFLEAFHKMTSHLGLFKFQHTQHHYYMYSYYQQVTSPDPYLYAVFVKL